MGTIYINKEKKDSAIRSFFGSFGFIWGLLCFSFFLNFKFLEGNDFLDFIIFLLMILSFVLLAVARKDRYYFDVKEEDFRPFYINNKK